MLDEVSARRHSNGQTIVGSLKRNAINLGFAGALLILVLTAIASLQGIAGLRERIRLIEYSQQVQLQIEELLTAFAEARVSWRNLLAGGRDDIANFEAAAQSIAVKISSLQSLISDNAAQQARLTQLASALTGDLAAMRESIHGRASGALSDPADVLRALAGNRLSIAEITRVAMQMRSEEQALLLRRGPQVDKQARETVTLIFVGNIVSLLMLIGAFSLLCRDVAERRSAEKKLQDSKPVSRFRAREHPQYDLHQRGPRLTLCRL